MLSGLGKLLSTYTTATLAGSVRQNVGGVRWTSQRVAKGRDKAMSTKAAKVSKWTESWKNECAEMSKCIWSAGLLWAVGYNTVARKKDVRNQFCRQINNPLNNN